MKFKKTKLTALAMSVLMAASTITSVTWAADLFTDGAPAEVAVEAPVDVEEIVPAVNQEEVISDDALLLSDPVVAKQVVGALFIDSYDDETSSTKKVKYQEIFNTDTQSDINDAIDAGKFPDRDILEAAAEMVTDEEVQSATCTQNEKAIYKFHYGDSVDENKWARTPYIDRFHGKKQLSHKLDEVIATITCEGSTATCTLTGIAYSYRGCKYCGRPVKLDDGKIIVDENADPLDYDTYAELEAKYVSGNEDKAPFITKVVVPATGHKMGSPYKSVKKLVAADPGDLKNPNKMVEGAYDTSTNCEIVNGNVAGPKDPKKDAYFYWYQKCTICGHVEQVGDVEYIHFPEMSEDEVLCKFDPDGPIGGFIALNAKGLLEKWDTVRLTITDKAGNPIYDSDTIPLALCKGAYLKDCSVGGSYYIYSHQSNTSANITRKEVIVEKGHTYGNVDLLKDNTLYLSTVTQKQYLTDSDGNYMLDYDADKNVIGARSNNCTKEAKYELYHICFGCGKEEKVGGVRTTAKGTVHVVTDWKVDPSKTVYTQIDAKQHKEHYIEVGTCIRCGKVEERDSKTPDAIKDHTFTAVEIKDTRVDPTCGVDGSFDRGVGQRIDGDANSELFFRLLSH